MILPRIARSEGSKTKPIEMREGDEVDSELFQVWEKLKKEMEAAGYTWEVGREEMVKITISGDDELKGSRYQKDLRCQST